MAREVAVHTGANGCTAAIDHAGTLSVYRRERGNWEVVRTMELTLDKSRGLAGLRNSLDEMIRFLGECSIFVAQHVAGIAYFALEKAGCNVWEVEGRPPGILDYVLHKEEDKEKDEEKPVKIATGPKDLGEGRFSIDLTAIQGSAAGITSKQALQSFVRKKQFFELHVQCSHIPPWLEAELLQGGLTWEAKKNGTKISMIISKEPCSMP